MNNRSSRRRFWLLLAGIVSLLLVLSWAYLLPDTQNYGARHSIAPTSAAADMTTDSTKTAESSVLRNQPQDALTSVREVLFEYAGRPVTVQDLLEGSIDPREFGIAFSPGEAAWMNREGVPVAGQDVIDAYQGTDLATLLVMAEGGDVRAAVAGAELAWRTAWVSSDGVQMNERISHSFGAEISDSDWHARATAARQMFERPEWQQMRALLWEGVVHGSSYAAQRMIRTYSDSFGTCYDANSCNAWALVAWRMGEWNLSLPTSFAPNSGQMPEISVALGLANRIWMNINAARAERGLSPLDLQLHPGFGVWDDFKRGEAEKPVVYRR